MKRWMTALMRLFNLGTWLTFITRLQVAQADTVLIANTVDDHDDGVCDRSRCSLWEYIAYCQRH